MHGPWIIFVVVVVVVVVVGSHQLFSFPVLFRLDLEIHYRTNDFTLFKLVIHGSSWPFLDILGPSWP